MSTFVTLFRYPISLKQKLLNPRPPETPWPLTCMVMALLDNTTCHWLTSGVTSFRVHPHCHLRAPSCHNLYYEVHKEGLIIDCSFQLPTRWRSHFLEGSMIDLFAYLSPECTLIFVNNYLRPGLHIKNTSVKFIWYLIFDIFLEAKTSSSWPKKHSYVGPT